MGSGIIVWSINNRICRTKWIKYLALLCTTGPMVTEDSCTINNKIIIALFHGVEPYVSCSFSNIHCEHFVIDFYARIMGMTLSNGQNIANSNDSFYIDPDIKNTLSKLQSCVITEPVMAAVTLVKPIIFPTKKCSEL